MKAIYINENWELFQTLPKVWNNKQPYNAIEEGFKDVIRPAITNTQRLGMLIYDDLNDVLTYQVIDKSQEEIFAEDLANATEVKSINFLVQLELEGVTEDGILSIIDTLPEPNKTIAKVSFKRATFFERSNPLLTLVGQAYGFDDTKLDEIFINANKLPI
jgi:hypothetical protein